MDFSFLDLAEADNERTGLNMQGMSSEDVSGGPERLRFDERWEAPPLSQTYGSV